jgi:hypothetical protein
MITKKITDELDFMKIKIFCVYVNANRIRRQPTDWEKIFAKDILDTSFLKCEI